MEGLGDAQSFWRVILGEDLLIWEALICHGVLNKLFNVKALNCLQSESVYLVWVKPNDDIRGVNISVVLPFLIQMPHSLEQLDNDPHKIRPFGEVLAHELVLSDLPHDLL